MTRSFHHLGEDWTAEAGYGATGVGVGGDDDRLPKFNRWYVTFTCKSNPDRGPYCGSVRKRDIREVPEDDLRSALEKAISRDQVR